MNEFKSLTKRNVLFTIMLLRFKIALFFGILLCIDFSNAINGNYIFFIQSIVGISQSDFVNNSFLLPYSWIYFLFGILILFHNDIFFDLYTISQNLIIKLHSKSIFLISKLFTEILFLIVFHFMLIIEKLLIIFLFPNLISLISINDIGKFLFLNIFVSIFLCMIYHFFVFASKNIILAYISCLIITIIGLPFKSKFFPIQFMMLKRTSIILGCFYCCIGTIIFFCLNIILFNYTDLLEMRKNYEK